MVAGRAHERGLGLGIADKLAFGKQPVAPSPLALDQQPALFAHEETAAGVLRRNMAVEELKRGKLASVVPDELDRRPVSSNLEIVTDDRPGGGRFRMRRDRRTLGLDAPRFTQLKRPEGGVDDVAPHVSQGAGAKIPPAAPLERVVGRMIGALRRRAEPEVPVQR